jgi:putative FmdB family regulatory protein
MPIYAYRCAACGHAKDVLQKISDPLLTVCPNCGKSEFQKQVTAAGFQLKGSGWYVTDFRGGGSAPAAGASSGESASPAPAPSASPAPAPAPAPTSKPSGGE